MFCKHCGTKLNDEAKFCKGCGAAVEPSSSNTKEETKNNSTVTTEVLDSKINLTPQSHTPYKGGVSSSTKVIDNEEAYKLLKQVTSNSARIEEMRLDSKGIILNGKYNRYIVNIVNGNVIVKIGARVWLAILMGLIWFAMLFTSSSQKEERDEVIQIICDTLGTNPKDINKAEVKRVITFFLMLFGILFVILGLFVLVMSYLVIEGTMMVMGFSITIASVFMIIMSLINRHNYKLKYENATPPSPKEKKKCLFILSTVGVLTIISIIFSALWINGVFDSYDYYDDDDYSISNWSNDSAVNCVRYGALEFYPTKTLGKALSGFLSNIKWESLKKDDTTYVKVSGEALYYDKPVTVTTQYKLNNDDTFEFHSIEIDGEPKEYEIYFELVVLSFENEIFSIIKEGTLYDYPNQPLGTAFGNFFEDIKWEVVAGEDFAVYVNISGGLLYGGEDATALLQYKIDIIELTFIYNAFEIDGIPQSYNMYYELIKLIFEDEAKDFDHTENNSGTSIVKDNLRIGLGEWRNSLFVDDETGDEWKYVLVFDSDYECHLQQWDPTFWEKWCSA